MQIGRPLYPSTGVWWDLNTCPVPAGFDVGLVRPSIEFALRISFGPGRPVTIFAVGNLDDISHDLLGKISSSGIHLRHAPSGWREVCDLIHQEWCSCLSRSAFIMLISGDPRWFSHCFTILGDTILRAYDGPPPEFPHCPATKVWGWESLLKGYSPSGYVSLVANCPARVSFPAWLCFLCKHATKSFDEFTTHLKSGSHRSNRINEVPSSEDLNHKHSYYSGFCQYPDMQGDSAIYPTTGVWWDLNTCPVPSGFDVGLVRPSIELALTKCFGPRPVTIFAVGNLDDISHDLLEKISSSGILLRHALIGGIEICELIDLEWCMKLPRSAPIMLISGDLRWFISCFTEVGDYIIRAYDGPPPEFPHCPPLKVWGWESLLKEYSHSGDVITNCLAPERFPAGLCFLCEQPTESFDDLTKHLKSDYHRNELLDFVPYKLDKPVHFCTLCKYPTYDSFTLDMHFRSEVHAQKAAFSELSSEKEARIVYQPNTSQEKDQPNTSQEKEQEES